MGSRGWWGPGAAIAGLLSAAAPPLPAQDAMFRVEDMDLRDPHVFFSFIGCMDFTDNASVGVSFNQLLQQAIQEDGDGDGLLDLSYVVEFLPLAQQASSTFLDRGQTECTAPLAGTACRTLQPWPSAALGSNLATGTCLAPVADTLTDGYSPEVTHATGPCFASAPASFLLDFAGIPVTLSEVVVAAQYVSEPATGLVNGLLRGFISEVDANATLIPDTYPLVGGQPLSTLLPGGQGNCAAHDDRDTNGTESGWYFYLNFTAPRVTLVPSLVFSDGFEALAAPGASAR